MTAEAKKLFEQALALPEHERSELRDVLTDSLRESEGDLSAAWTEEITRRIAAIERGESHLIPGDEVEARLDAALGRV